MPNINDSPGGLADFMPPVLNDQSSAGGGLIIGGGGASGLVGGNGGNGGSGPYIPPGTTFSPTTPKKPYVDTIGGAGTDTGAEGYITNPKIRNALGGISQPPRTGVLGSQTGVTEIPESTTPKNYAGIITDKTRTTTTSQQEGGNAGNSGDNNDYGNVGNHPHPTAPTAPAPTGPAAPATAAPPTGFTPTENGMSSDDYNDAKAAGLNTNNVVGVKTLPNGQKVYALSDGSQVQVNPNAQATADNPLGVTSYRVKPPTGTNPAAAPQVAPTTAPTAPGTPISTGPTPPPDVVSPPAPPGVHGPVENTWTNPQTNVTYWVMSDGQIYAQAKNGTVYKAGNYGSADASTYAIKHHVKLKPGEKLIVQ